MKKKILIISGILIFTIVTFSLFSPFKKSLQTDTLKITGKFKQSDNIKEILIGVRLSGLECNLQSLK